MLSPVGACGLTRTISAYPLPAGDGDAIVCSLWLWALPFKKRSPAASLVVCIDFKFYDMPIYIYICLCVDKINDDHFNFNPGIVWVFIVLLGCFQSQKELITLWSFSPRKKPGIIAPSHWFQNFFEGHSSSRASPGAAAVMKPWASGNDPGLGSYMAVPL